MIDWKSLKDNLRQDLKEVEWQQYFWLSAFVFILIALFGR